MKVLIFSVAYHPFVGGAEVAVKEITNRLSEIEFHMVTVNLDGQQLAEEKIGNVFVHRVGEGKMGKYLLPFWGGWKALSLHREHNFDAVWSIMANYAGFAALLFKYLKPKVIFILTLQEGDPISYIKRRVGLFYPFFKDIFFRADRIQAISQYLANFAKDMGANVPAMVIPNGVDVSIFDQNYSENELEKLKLGLGKRAGDFLVVTSSRLVVKNDIARVIEALKYLPENVKFLILGDGELKTELKNLREKLDLNPRVTFLGFVPHDLLPKYLKISDVFVRPSLSEGMGNSFIEAMAAGLPVIATPVGGIVDFLKDGETGLFCEVNDPKSISEKIKLLMVDQKLRERLIENGRSLAQTKYDWNLIAKNMQSRVFGQV